MIEAYEKIISNIQEDDLAVTRCTLRKIRQLMEEIDVYKRQELFGLRVIIRQEGNVIMSEGLVLQAVDVWYDSTKIPTTPRNNMTELYFEDNDIDGIIEKLESGKYVVSYVTELMELEGGQKLVSCLLYTSFFLSSQETS